MIGVLVGSIKPISINHIDDYDEQINESSGDHFASDLVRAPQ